MSRFILDDLERIERRSEERMRLDLLKADATDSSPREILIRLRSSEILLKMRWCNEGDVAECIKIGEELFRECQFNQAQDVFLRAKKHLDKMPRELDGFIFDGSVRQEVETGVNKTDPSHRTASCATYALRCCDSADAEEAALWERLWSDYRSHANVAFSGLPIQDGTERLWLGAVRGVVLRKQHEFVQGLETIDAVAAGPPREALMAATERFCNSGESMSCQILTESYLRQCRFREAEAAWRRTMSARAAETEAIKRIQETGKAQEILRRELATSPRGFSDPAMFSEERRVLCERLRSVAPR